MKPRPEISRYRGTETIKIEVARGGLLRVGWAYSPEQARYMRAEMLEEIRLDRLLERP